MSTQPFTQSTATLAACKLVAFKSPSEARGKKQTQGLQVLAAAATALVEVRNPHHLSAGETTDFVSSKDLKERFSHILKFGRENLLDGLAVSRKRSKDYIRGSLRLFAMHWAMDRGQAKFREEVSDHLPFCAHFQCRSNRQD